MQTEAEAKGEELILAQLACLQDTLKPEARRLRQKILVRQVGGKEEHSSGRREGCIMLTTLP